MIKIFKDVKTTGGHGITVVTNATKPQEFISELSSAIVESIENHNYDDDNMPIKRMVRGILENSFKITLKLSGYKAPEVQEERLLQAGFVAPNESNKMVDTSIMKVIDFSIQEDNKSPKPASNKKKVNRHDSTATIRARTG